MGIFFDEQGQEIEAFTPEEVEQKLEEIRQQTIEEVNAQRQEEIDDLINQLEEKEKEIETAKEELEKEKSKDKNLIGQRKKIEEKEKEVEELKKQMTELKENFEKKLTEFEIKGKEKIIQDMIQNLAGQDKELADKIKFFYDAFKGEPENEQELKERIQNAYILATGGKQKNPLSGSVISSTEGYTAVISPSEKLNPEQRDLAKKLGITDAELKKRNLI